MAGEKVGDFYGHVLHGTKVEANLTSSNKLLRGQPTVISFYDGSWGGCRPCAAQMEKWANEYHNVRFLAACVDQLGVAQQFARMFQFHKVVHCHIPSREYFPVGFGQLGCAGFIVSDESGCFVSRKTQAYLQYGDVAFRHLEGLLEKEFGVTKLSQTVVVSSRNAKQRKEEEEKKEEGLLSHPVASVGIASMDKEHEACEQALAKLLSSPNSRTLEKALVALTGHFHHEQELMKAHGFGNANTDDPFSAFSWHVKDHERILELGYDELGHVEVGACTGGGAVTSWHTKAVEASVAKNLLHAFRTHAERFDKLYEDQIPSDAV